MKEAFISRNFGDGATKVIAQANVIIAEYQAANFKLTLRQLYYQFVARALIPNKQSEYKRLGAIVDDGRKAGLIDWDAIEDRTRNLESPNTWESPQAIVNAVADQYEENPWRAQAVWPEVWIEKDALTGVIEPVCQRMRVPYFACRGHVSSSEMHSAGKRFERLARRGYKPLVLHLGDHDPSGVQMTDDIRDRLTMFARQPIQVKRIALTMAQVEQYNPPPNPAKESDSRFADYAAQYGTESWELDALEPPVVDALIQGELDAIIDTEKWTESMAAETEHKDALQQVADRWDDVTVWLGQE